MLLHPAENKLKKFDEKTLMLKCRELALKSEKDFKANELYSIDNLAFYNFIPIEEQIDIGKEISNSYKIKENYKRCWIDFWIKNLKLEAAAKKGHLIFSNHISEIISKDISVKHTNFRIQDDFLATQTIEVQNLYRRHSPHMLAWLNTYPEMVINPERESWVKKGILETMENNNLFLELVSLEKKEDNKETLIKKGTSIDLPSLFFFNIYRTQEAKPYNGPITASMQNEYHRAIFLFFASYRAKYHYLNDRAVYKYTKEKIIVEKILLELATPAAIRMHPKQKDDILSISHAMHIAWDYILKINLFKS